MQQIGQTHSHFWASVIPQSDRDAVKKICITVFWFIFSPGDGVAPHNTNVIGDINCEVDTEVRHQRSQVNGNQPPGIWSFTMQWDPEPKCKQAGYWVKRVGSSIF